LVSTPKAPDPVATAEAQSGMNRDTATSQQLINMTNQNNPWGSVSYSPNGSSSFVDSQGKTVTVPQYTQTTTLSPEQQGIFDKSQQAQSNIAGIASDQSAKLGEYLDKPFTFDNHDAENWAYDLGQQRIAPQQAHNEELLRSRLVNAGLRPGTQAWDSEMQRMTMANTDQNNQLALNGRQQGFSEALATRNQPINEITALLSGSQVSNPATMSSATPQAQVGGVDYTGLVNNNYNQQVASSNALMGGLFGLAGTGATAAMKFSDRRLKTDIKRVGQLDNGLPVYSYRYKAGGPTEIGLMSNDVRRQNPSAVASGPNGYDMVDYARAAC
jgi:hypothetical protein